MTFSDDSARCPAASRLRRISDRGILALYLAGSLLVLLSAALVSAAALHEEHANRLESAERDTANLARAFEEHIHRTFRALDQQSRLIADDYLADPEPQRLGARLHRLLALEDAAVQHAIIDADGRLHASSAERRGIDLSDREHFRHHLRPGALATFVSRPLVGRASGKWSIQYTRRIEDAAGGFRGVAVASFDPEYLTRFYRSVDLGPRGVIALLGEDGIVRARSVDMERHIGRDLGHSTLLVHAARAPVDTYRSPSALDGVERIVSYRKVRDFPLLVAVAYAVDDVMRGFDRYVALHAGVLAFLLLVVITLGGLLRAYVGDRTEAERGVAEALSERRERQFLASILETAGVLVVVTGSGGRIEVANPRFAALFAADGGGVDWCPQATGFSLEAIVARLPFSCEAQASDREGRRRSLEWTFTAVRDEDGRLRHLIGIGLDNTERRETELMLYQSAKLVTLGEMATGLAHELNQPLNAIRLTIENVARRALQGPAEPGYLTAKFDKIRRNVERAAGIVDHMRIYGRRSERSAVAVDPEAAIAGALSITAASLREHGIACRRGPGCGGHAALAELGLLEQVLINLVLNARDAILTRCAQGGGGEDWIEIGCTPLADGRLRIAVSDTGGGVPAALRDRIFEPFFTTKPVGQGMGLGLSLSHGIVRDFGGELRLREGARGAVFELDLPMAPA